MRSTSMQNFKAIVAENQILGSGFSETLPSANIPTTADKIFETSSSFHLKWRTMGKVQFAFFRRFLLVVAKVSFWEEV